MGRPLSAAVVAEQSAALDPEAAAEAHESLNDVSACIERMMLGEGIPKKYDVFKHKFTDIDATLLASQTQAQVSLSRSESSHFVMLEFLSLHRHRYGLLFS
jgi:hypothetical protein